MAYQIKPKHFKHCNNEGHDLWEKVRQGIQFCTLSILLHDNKTRLEFELLPSYANKSD